MARDRNVDVVIDVGANEGLFALGIRGAGFQGRIVSVEPLSSALAKLEAASARDPLWEPVGVALGAREGRATLNVAANWASSSFMPMADRLLDAEPRTAYVGREECTVTTLDALRSQLFEPEDRVYLKLDVQGFELEVLRGAEQTLAQVEVVDAELSLVELYDGGPLFGEVVQFLDRRGFGPVGLEPSFIHPQTGAILQVDGLFIRA